MGALLSIDIGTTNWKSAAFDFQGNMLSIKKTNAITNYDVNGRGYHDPFVLWDCISKLIKKVLEDIVPNEVEAISVTGMAEAVVPMSGNGPVSHIVPWYDISALEEALFLKSVFGENLFKITGLEGNPALNLCKIMWIEKKLLNYMTPVTMWLSIVDYINWCLTGEFATDYTLASRTMAFDLGRNTWSDEILNEAKIASEKMPQIKKSGTFLGRLSKKASKKTGVLQGTPVIIGGHDHLCGALAMGMKPNKMILDSSGTAESFITLTESRLELTETYNGLRVGKYLDPDYSALWGGIPAAGCSVDWALKMFIDKEFDSKDFNSTFEKVSEIMLGADGLIYIPHLRGSGAPFWNPKQSGAFLGLKDTHSEYHMMRAVLEGLSFQARMILEQQDTILKRKTGKLYAVGGGTRIKQWQQIKADITGKQIVLPKAYEATLQGAALLAGIGIGAFKSITEIAVKPQNEICSFNPDEKNEKKYEMNYRQFKKAAFALEELNLTD